MWIKLTDGLPKESGFFLCTYYDQTEKGNKTYPTWYSAKDKRFYVVVVRGDGERVQLWTADEPIAYAFLPTAFETE